MLNGLFVSEGTSDGPLAEIVTSLFMQRGVPVRLSTPDFEYLDKVKKDVESRLIAGAQLVNGSLDLIVVHRDADSVGSAARRKEIEQAATPLDSRFVLPVIPIRMTEAWLLLDEGSIRRVAGNPRGRAPLPLPKVHEVERVADPKSLLQQCLLEAADHSGRRRDKVAKRFPQHRRQLLERLDCTGPVTGLSSWQQLVNDIEQVVRRECQQD